MPPWRGLRRFLVGSRGGGGMSTRREAGAVRPPPWLPHPKAAISASADRRLTEAGYDIIAIETWIWDDGDTETEILWAKDEQPIEASEVPF